MVRNVQKARLLVAVLVAGALVFLNAPQTVGQTVVGRILGTIRDSQGAVIPNAAVSAKNLETGAAPAGAVAVRVAAAVIRAAAGVVRVAVVRLAVRVAMKVAAVAVLVLLVAILVLVEIRVLVLVVAIRLARRVALQQLRPATTPRRPLLQLPTTRRRPASAFAPP